MNETGDPSASKPVASPSSTRRALLGAGLGSLAAFVASALARPSPVAAQDEYMQVGHQYPTPSLVTSLVNTTNSNPVFLAQSTGAGTAVTGASSSGQGLYGHSTSGDGVLGSSESGVGIHGAGGAIGVLGEGTGAANGVSGTSASGFGLAGSSSSSYGVYGEANGSGSAAIGVHGTSAAGVGMLGKSRAAAQPATVGWSGGNSTGIQGFSNDNSANPPAPRAKTGVMGQATQDSSSRGVLGISTTGNGVRGEASSGVAVQGVASNVAGYAIRGSGRVRFDKVSGQATLAAGTTSKTITPGTDVTTESFVLLTPMADLGGRRLWFTRNTTTNTITIHLSSAMTSSVVIAWLLLN